MSIVLALALLTNSGDALDGSARRLEQIMPGVSRHLIMRDETSGWFSAERYAGRVVVPAAVYDAAQSDAERDAATILTVAYARTPAEPLLSPAGNFLLEMAAATLSSVAESELEQGTLPPGFGELPTRGSPPPMKRALTLATRHGIGVCPMVALVDRLAAPQPNGQLTAIALDARRVRRDLGAAAYGC